MRNKMGALAGQMLIFILLLPLVNSTNSIAIRKSYVDICEKFWENAPVKWKHNVINNAKQLKTHNDAKKYIDDLRMSWKIQGKDGADEFIKQLQLNAKYDGLAANEFIDGEYVTGGQEGELTYIYVIMHVDRGDIAVTFSYHHIEENLIGSKYGYASQAKDITVEWLRWKAWESVRSLAPKFAPEITWV